MWLISLNKSAYFLNISFALKQDSFILLFFEVLAQVDKQLPIYLQVHMFDFCFQELPQGNRMTMIKVSIYDILFSGNI